MNDNSLLKFDKMAVSLRLHSSHDRLYQNMTIFASGYSKPVSWGFISFRTCSSRLISLYKRHLHLKILLSITGHSSSLPGRVIKRSLQVAKFKAGATFPRFPPQVLCHILMEQMGIVDSKLN